jgi:hypothetical protein
MSRLVTHERNPGEYFCTSTSIPTWIPLTFIPGGVFDIVLFVLALWAFFKEINHVREMRRHWNMQSLFAILMRDSLCYFVV